MMPKDALEKEKAVVRAQRKEFRELYGHFLRAKSESEAFGYLGQLRAYNVIFVDGIRFDEQNAMEQRKKMQEARQHG